MAKVLILGSTGMLGSAIGNYFLNDTDHDVYLTFKNENVSYGNKKYYFDPLVNGFHYDVWFGKYDYVINAIGIIKPYMKSSIANAIELNSLFPHKLAKFCKDRDMKLIHITTDCVYSGFNGPYKESDESNALDEYGKSKSLGEPIDNAMVIRTSIVGEEIHKNASLVSWVKKQKNSKIKGFTNHYWNGITTKQYGKICAQIIKEDLYEEGLFHVFSNDINKFEMMNVFNNKWDLNINISAFEASSEIDRRLRTTKNLNGKLNIPTFEEMIKEL